MNTYLYGPMNAGEKVNVRYRVAGLVLQEKEERDTAMVFIRCVFVRGRMEVDVDAQNGSVATIREEISCSGTV